MYAILTDCRTADGLALGAEKFVNIRCLIFFYIYTTVNKLISCFKFYLKINNIGQHFEITMFVNIEAEMNELTFQQKSYFQYNMLIFNLCTRKFSIYLPWNQSLQLSHWIINWVLSYGFPQKQNNAAIFFVLFVVCIRQRCQFS